MSQEQPSRPQQDDAIKYGDVFNVTGNLADQPIAPQDASMMQSEKNLVLGQYPSPTPIDKGTPCGSGEAPISDSITIGEALEASAMSAGDKAVDRADAAAIQAAEVRATGSNYFVPGGLTSQAQSAADTNARINRDDAKTKLGDILQDATMKLTADKEVTREDAEGVLGAEIRNKPDMSTHPGGVAASVVAAARLNLSFTD